MHAFKRFLGNLFFKGLRRSRFIAILRTMSRFSGAWSMRTTSVFLERHIQAPMQPVFDVPIAALDPLGAANTRTSVSCEGIPFSSAAYCRSQSSRSCPHSSIACQSSMPQITPHSVTKITCRSTHAASCTSRVGPIAFQCSLSTSRIKPVLPLDLPA